MKFAKEHIVTVLLWFTRVVLIILVFSLIRKIDGRAPIKEISEAYQQIIKSKDETIQAIQRERDTFREWKDSAISELNKRNDQLSKDYSKTIILHDKIPVYINALGNDSLRAAAERWAN